MGRRHGGSGGKSGKAARGSRWQATSRCPTTRERAQPSQASCRTRPAARSCPHHPARHARGDPSAAPCSPAHTPGGHPPERRAARVFSFTPPMGSTLPVSVTSPARVRVCGGWVGGWVGGMCVGVWCAFRLLARCPRTQAAGGPPAPSGVQEPSHHHPATSRSTKLHHTPNQPTTHTHTHTHKHTQAQPPPAHPSSPGLAARGGLGPVTAGR